jgi:hypothetical protein
MQRSMDVFDTFSQAIKCVMAGIKSRVSEICSASIIFVDPDDRDGTNLPNICVYFNHNEADARVDFSVFLDI